MNRRPWLTSARVLFALLAVAALVYQLKVQHDKPNFRPGNFFSFFTIESNIFALVVLLIAAWCSQRDQPPSAAWDYVRGAAVLYMTVTGVVYGLLLAGYQEELQTTVPWVDTVLHKVMPLVMIADWLIDPPRTRLAFKRALGWLAYPLVYCVYSLIRGPIVDWYPYPFLDHRLAGGYGGVALYCLGIAIGALIGVWLVVTVGNRVRLSASPAPQPP